MLLLGGIEKIHRNLPTGLSRPLCNWHSVNIANVSVSLPYYMQTSDSAMLTPLIISIRLIRRFRAVPAACSGRMKCPFGIYRPPPEVQT